MGGGSGCHMGYPEGIGLGGPTQGDPWGGILAGGGGLQPHLGTFGGGVPKVRVSHLGLVGSHTGGLRLGGGSLGVGGIPQQWGSPQCQQPGGGGGHAVTPPCAGSKNANNSQSEVVTVPLEVRAATRLSAFG